MTKILYNRAAKTFMDAISAGFDEDGAYEKVKKKHGKVLADAVYAEALTEMKAMKKNPRERLDVVKNQKGVIRINPAQLSILVDAHRSKSGFWYAKSETQSMNAAKLASKDMLKRVPNQNREGYKLTDKGKSLLERFLKSVHQSGKIRRD